MAKGKAIASGAVLLTTDADPLHAGLKREEASIKKWAKGAFERGGSLTSSIGAGIMGFAASGGSLLAGAGSGIGMALGGPVGAAVGGAIGTGVGKGLETSAAVVSGFIDTIGDVSKMGDMATALGLTSEQFTGMAGVAKSVGEDTREFIESLVTMGKLGTDAAKGTEEASAAFKAMGLNAKEFIKLRADEQFFKVFDSLSKMSDPLQRTRALMAAFGEDGGKYLLPLLKKTPEEIRKMADEFAISGEKMKRAQEAQQAIGKLKVAGQKMWQDIAIFAAPAIEKVAQFGSWVLRTLQPVFDWMSRAWDTTATFASGVWDYITSSVGAAIAIIREEAGGMFDWIGEIPTIQEVLKGFFFGIVDYAAFAWDEVKYGAGTFAEFVGDSVKYLERFISFFAEFTKGIIRDAATVAEALGFTDTAEKMKAAENYIDRYNVRLQTSAAQLKAWGIAQKNSYGKAQEDAKAWFHRVMDMKAEAAAPIETKVTPVKGDKVEFAGAFAKGSKEAYSLVVKSQFQSALANPQKDLLKETKKVAKNGEKANKSLDNISKAVAKLGVW